MKKTFAITALLLALLVTLLPERLMAQVWNNSTSGSWQSASWGQGDNFPGSTTNNLAVFIAPTTSDLTISNATPPASIGSLRIMHTSGTHSVTLNGNGTLTINGDLTVENSLIIGAGLRVVVNGSVRGSAPILVSNGGLLRLTSTATTAIESTASFAVPASAAGGTVELAVGWNAGFLPGTVFGNDAKPFNGIIRISSTCTLSSPLVIGSLGIFDFSTAATAPRLILASSATILGTIRNVSTTRYFVTSDYPLALNNVGNLTFPVGPTTTVFAPLNISNNGTPATFSVRAMPFVTATPPFATGSAVLWQSIVNQQWNVSQLTGVTAGFGVGIAPLWIAPQENAGFNRALAVTNVFTTTSGTISSSPQAAASDLTYAGYFRSAVTVTQISSNNLNNTPILVSSQPAPAIRAFTPPCQSSGATITITGNRFAPGASVSLGGVSVPAANVTLISGGSSGIDTLRVVVPSNAASGDVRVTQTGGSSTVSQFGCNMGAPLQPAVIYKVTPSPLPAGLGDVEVVINGAAFGILTPRVVAVGSGITSTITPSANTTTRIIATIPGNIVRNLGSVSITVTSLDRLPVSTTVTVSAPPPISLASLMPSVTNSNLQPFTIRVTGTSFSAQSLFTLGKDTLRVLSVLRNSDGSLIASVEARPGIQSGNLTVSNLNNQSASLPFLVGTVGVVEEPTIRTLVFPNPVEDIVRVEAHHFSSGSIFITITNVFGQSIISAKESVTGGQYNQSFNLSGLPPGVYLLEIRDGVRREVHKILKK